MKFLFTTFLALLLIAVFFVNAESEEKICSARNSSCSFCTDGPKCTWCEPSQSCSHYSIIPKGCNKAQWYIGQCTVAGYWLIIVIPCVAVFIIICLVCCCCCCCCRRDREAEETKILLKSTKRRADSDRRQAYHEERNVEREVERV